MTGIGINPSEQTKLDDFAKAHKDKAWSTKGAHATRKNLVTKFKANLKNHLYRIAQTGHCCYCGSDLASHQRTYDVEHIIAKDNKSTVVFHLKNLALSCGTCNNKKKVKPVTKKSGVDPDNVFMDSDKYILVHPHLDSWEDHLCFDGYRRVIAKVQQDGNVSSKGKETIDICGIHGLNAMRLSYYFDCLRVSVQVNEDWESLYVALNTGATLKPKLKEFASKLLKDDSDPAVTQIKEALGSAFVADLVAESRGSSLKCSILEIPL